jgi:hypothetical protein
MTVFGEALVSGGAGEANRAEIVEGGGEATERGIDSRGDSVWVAYTT